MNLRRPFILPCVLLVGSAVVIACGDDDTTGGSTSGTVQPGNDAGRDAGSSGNPLDAGRDTGSTPTDSGSDSGEGGSENAPVITTTTLTALVAGTAAAPVTLAATGATPITWSVTAGALPAGLALSAAGELSGTPTVVGDFTFTVTATNASGTDTQDFTLSVTAPPVNAYALLADGKLSAFATSFPAGATAGTAITGVGAGETLVSLDRRPQNGFLYALSTSAGGFRLYAIDPQLAHATPLGAAAAFATATAGTTFGIDFNPTVDRVRVLTSGGNNFRMNPNTGALVDGDGVTGGVQRDGDLAGGSSTAAAETAYTNNAPNALVTTQYSIVGTSLYIQNPPNNGTLTTPLALANVESIFGFEIPAGVDVASNHAAATGNGFAALKLTGQAATQLSTINLSTGAITAVGDFPYTNLVGMTTASPTRTIIALKGDGSALLRFTEASLTPVEQAVSNINIGETLVGIDFRPATGQLYGLGVNATLNTATLYLIDPQGGALTAVGTPGGIAFTTGGAITPLDMPDPATVGYGFDFNAGADRIRVTTGDGANFRVHPDTGAAVDGDANTAGTNPDGAITTGLSGVAYTNGTPATLPGVTTEYGISSATDSLYIVTSPNVGTLGPAIAITVNGAPLDFTAVNGFDIPSTVTAATSNAAVASGSAYAVLNVGGASNLYRINLVDGVATLVGAVGTGTTAIRGLAVGR